MAQLVGKEPTAVTQAEINWLVNVAQAGVGFIGQGANAKAATILTDIANHFSDNARPSTAKPESTSEEETLSPQVLCSQCIQFLPDEAEYLACLKDCTH